MIKYLIWQFFGNFIIKKGKNYQINFYLNLFKKYQSCDFCCFLLRNIALSLLQWRLWEGKSTGTPSANGGNEKSKVFYLQLHQKIKEFYSEKNSNLSKSLVFLT